MPDKKNKNTTDKDKKEAPLKPDPETLHTTDPQENMKGPISSVMQNIKEGAEDEETKESADKKKDKNM
jgi:hypothetical protein